MNQNSKHIIQIQHWVEIRWVLNSKTLTETLEQQKSNSWTPVGPTKDRASSSNQQYWKFFVIGLTTKHAHNIYVVSSSFITNDVLTVQNSFSAKNIFEIYTLSHHEIRALKGLA